MKGRHKDWMQHVPLLADDLVVKILSFFKYTEMLQFRLVCRSFNEIIRDRDDVWVLYYRYEFGSSVRLRKDCNVAFMDCYLTRCKQKGLFSGNFTRKEVAFPAVKETFDRFVKVGNGVVLNLTVFLQKNCAKFEWTHLGRACGLEQQSESDDLSFDSFLWEFPLRDAPTTTIQPYFSADLSTAFLIRNNSYVYITKLLKKNNRTVKHDNLHEGLLNFTLFEWLDEKIGIFLVDGMVYAKDFCSTDVSKLNCSLRIFSILVWDSLLFLLHGNGIDCLQYTGNSFVKLFETSLEISHFQRIPNSKFLLVNHNTFLELPFFLQTTIIKAPVKKISNFHFDSFVLLLHNNQIVVFTEEFEEQFTIPLKCSTEPIAINIVDYYIFVTFADFMSIVDLNSGKEIRKIKLFFDTNSIIETIFTCDTIYFVHLLGIDRLHFAKKRHKKKPSTYSHYKHIDTNETPSQLAVSELVRWEEEQWEAKRLEMKMKKFSVDGFSDEETMIEYVMMISMDDM